MKLVAAIVLLSSVSLPALAQSTIDGTDSGLSKGFRDRMYDTVTKGFLILLQLSSGNFNWVQAAWYAER